MISIFYYTFCAWAGFGCLGVAGDIFMVKMIKIHCGTMAKTQAIALKLA